MHRETWRRAARIVLWPVGLTAAAGLVVVGTTDERAAGHGLLVVLSALVGATFIASGLIASRRHPQNRLGPSMVVLGFLWLFGQLASFSHSQLVFTIGMFANDAWVVPLAYVLVSFPSGRMRGSVDRATLAVFAFAAFPLELLWLLFFDPGPPGNALQIWDEPRVADALDWVQRVLFTGASIALAGVLAHRWYKASAPLRRRLTPILAGALTLVLADVNLLVDKIIGRETSEALQIAVLCALTAIPIAVLVDMLRARLARSAVGDLVVALRRDRSPGALRDALAQTLGDPSLQVVFWLPDYDGYADADGRAVDLPDDPARVTTMIDHAGARVAALVHDPFLHDEPELLDAVGAAAGFALDNARLQTEMLAGVEELRAARVRILEAAQSERRRLERDLHDGAQQRLVSLSLQLGMLEARFGSDPDARGALAQARGELGESLNELRELARGIHPAVVAGHGLEVALEGLAARAPVPVRVSVDLDGRLPEPIEVATYFLVSECLTNVAKYACATTASIAVTRADGEVVVEVADDGVGGANATAGSGLRGMVDRVEALGGHLELDSPVGDGTRMRAQIPCG
jgi:signal transduction histidine kinase